MDTLDLKTSKENVAGSYRQGQVVDCRAPREHSAHRPWRLSRGQGVTPPLPSDSPHVQDAIRGPLPARQEGVGAPRADSKQAWAFLNAMPEASNEPTDGERQGRPERTRETSASRDLVVGQITASERRLWEERAASFDEHSDPGEQDRREAARQERQQKAAPKQSE